MRTLLLIACASLLGGCRLSAGPSPSKSDLVGEWDSSDGAKLVINSDGSASISKASLRRLMFDDQPSVSYSSKGTWGLTVPPGEPSWPTMKPFWAVDISFSTPTQGAPGGFGAEANFTRMMCRATCLFFFVGDPDENERYEFFKASQVAGPIGR